MGSHAHAPAQQAVVSFPGDPSGWFELVPGERMQVRLGAAETAGRFTLTDSIIAPGAVAPSHYHRSVDEMFFVTKGTIHFTVDHETIEASVGTVVLVPRGAVHGFANRGGESGRLLALFTPGGMEELFVAFPDTPAEGRVALAAQYDTVLMAPEGG